MVNPKEIEHCEQFGLALCTRFAAIREEKGISKNELSQRSGLSRSAILKIEKGERRPTVATMYRLCKALDICFWQLAKEQEGKGES